MSMNQTYNNPKLEELYKNGLEAKHQKKLEKAAEYFEEAAIAGYMPAAYELALLYLEGYDWDIDLEALFSDDDEFGLFPEEDPSKAFYEAEKWLIRASDKGYMKAILKLGDLYTHTNAAFREERWKYDIETGLNWYKKAEAAGCMEVYIHYGDFYYKEEDYEKTVQFYEKGLQAGVRECGIILGDLYFMENAMPLDYEAAFRYYEQTEHFMGMKNCYLFGLGVEKDLNKVLECYEQFYLSNPEKVQDNCCATIKYPIGSQYIPLYVDLYKFFKYLGEEYYSLLPDSIWSYIMRHGEVDKELDVSYFNGKKARRRYEKDEGLDSIIACLVHEFLVSDCAKDKLLREKTYRYLFYEYLKETLDDCLEEADVNELIQMDYFSFKECNVIAILKEMPANYMQLIPVIELLHLKNTDERKIDINPLVIFKTRWNPYYYDHEDSFAVLAYFYLKYWKDYEVSLEEVEMESELMNRLGG